MKLWSWLRHRLVSSADQMDERLPCSLSSLFLAARALVALTVSVVADVQDRSALRLYTKWDAQWYAGIAENGYGFVRQHEMADSSPTTPSSSLSRR